MRHIFSAAFALVLAVGHAQAGTFYDLNTPSAQLTGLSHNGRIAGLYNNGAAYRWAKDRGVVEVAGFNSINGMSSWGQPLAGAAVDGEGNTVAAVAFSNADVAGGPIVIGPWPGGVAQDSFLSSAYDVSDNGIVVGLAIDENQDYFAFRWTSAEGMSRLPVNRPQNPSRANAISADGSTIVGWNDQDNGGRTAVIWRDSVPMDLVDAEGNAVGEALAVNADGSVVVGLSYLNSKTGALEAWRWTQETGVQGIGCYDDGFMCGPAFAFAVSDDGNTVVGASGFGFNRLATIWTPETGMQLLSDVVTAQGVVIPDGWTLSSAGGVSADGKMIGGWGLSPTVLTSFVIDLHETEPTHARVTASGTVNWNDLPDGPFAGVPEGTEVTMEFLIALDGQTELDPGQATRYPIVLDSFQLRAGEANDTMIATEFGPGLILSNDYPLSDGIHLFDSPMATDGQTMEFELFNPGGDLFDSDDLSRINRSFGPEYFEKISWIVSQQGGSFGMFMNLNFVSVHDADGSDDEIFADGFENAPD